MLRPAVPFLPQAASGPHGRLPAAWAGASLPRPGQVRHLPPQRPGGARACCPDGGRSPPNRPPGSPARPATMVPARQAGGRGPPQARSAGGRHNQYCHPAPCQEAP